MKTADNNVAQSIDALRGHPAYEHVAAWLRDSADEELNRLVTVTTERQAGRIEVLQEVVRLLFPDADANHTSPAT